jgi:hypothetical protein
VHTGRLPLFCFFVAFVTGFTAIRVSVRLIRAGCDGGLGTWLQAPSTSTTWCSAWF